MERLRAPFQGVTNIIRFNWHFYLLAALLLLALYIFNVVSNGRYALYLNSASLLMLLTIIVSLLVSFYVYDVSSLYSLCWLDKAGINATGKILNINAGFDETSRLLKAKYPDSELIVFDFYNEATHTEVSIKRARSAYPPYPGTGRISTTHIPLQNKAADAVCVLLSAHEIRNSSERSYFFKELRRVVNGSGKIIITEHLRDLPNFLAYNIGAFHFLSKPCWYRTFKEANLTICDELKITPFITTFILEKDGTAS